MQNQIEAKPPIMVTDTDLLRLQEYFTVSPCGANDAVMQAIDDELARAQVIVSRDVPPTLVTMNSRIVFENGSTSRRREVTLVYPRDASATQGRISVFSPVGAALLGLSVGQEIDWELPNGRAARFRIAEILYQPEAAGDHHL
jgi:regulator of nucleoside diphosphate kinase